MCLCMYFTYGFCIFNKNFVCIDAYVYVCVYVYALHIVNYETFNALTVQFYCSPSLSRIDANRHEYVHKQHIQHHQHCTNWLTSIYRQHFLDLVIFPFIFHFLIFVINDFMKCLNNYCMFYFV